MPDELIVIDGTSFFFTNRDGDFDARSHEGFFFEDVRHLSRWELLVDGTPLDLVSAKRVDYFSARIQLNREDILVTARRDRFAADGLHEDIVLVNRDSKPRRVRLELRFASDFADVREAQEEGVVRRGRRTVDLNRRSVTLRCIRRGYERGTRIGFSRVGELRRDRAVFDVRLPGNGEWKLCVDVEPITNGELRPARLRCDSFNKPEPHMPLPMRTWIARAPKLDTDDRVLADAYDRGLRDVGALRLRPTPDLPFAAPGGGIPWFMTLFGRDALITSFETLPFEQTIASETLRALAALQATEWDDFADAEPGKIVHEVRRGTLARTGAIPPLNYGGHDGTPLFLIVLDEYERWTADTRLVRELEPAARAALQWLEGPADRDRDGYLEYETHSPPSNAARLENQGWKDSGDAIVDHRGRLAPRPHATCELQGFAYAARLAMARLARDVYADPELAERLEREAAELKERFNRDFWIPRKRQFALALDGRKRQVDARSSNIGQLLWTRIADEGKARETIRTLTRDDMFTGWGIRSLSAHEVAYDPMSYHRGSVWPHDTALAVLGMRRHGVRRDVARIARGLLDASAALGSDLPELFAGFPRDATDFAVEYPGAMQPQAWASAAPLLLLRALLGLEVEDGELHVDPVLPANTTRLALRGVRFRGKRVDVG